MQLSLFRHSTHKVFFDALIVDRIMQYLMLGDILRSSRVSRNWRIAYLNTQLEPRTVTINSLSLTINNPFIRNTWIVHHNIQTTNNICYDEDIVMYNKRITYHAEPFKHLTCNGRIYKLHDQTNSVMQSVKDIILIGCQHQDLIHVTPNGRLNTIFSVPFPRFLELVTVYEMGMNERLIILHVETLIYFYYYNTQHKPKRSNTYRITSLSNGVNLN